MIETAELKRAVEAALQQLQQQPDIREIEVFAASNATLLTRLNYTSHIPCNGVEEPKSNESYGIGLNVVFETPEGIKVGFGSETSNLTAEGVLSALEKARKGAVHDPEFQSLPRPGTEQRTLVDYHDPALMKIRDEDLVAAGWQVVDGGLQTFMGDERLLKLAGGIDNLDKLGLIIGGDVTIIQERIAIGSTHLPVQTDESTLIMSFVTSMVERKDAKGSACWTGTRLADFSGTAGSEAARRAIDSIDGQRVKDGAFTVVFGSQPVTDLLNNIILPSLSLSTMYSASSTFQGKLGKQVASEQLTIYDHGALPGHMGSKGITCEGLPTGKTMLIDRGRLTGLLTNYYERQRILADPNAVAKLGVAPADHLNAIVPRNGFRFGRGGGRSYEMTAGIASTNVFVEGADERPIEELIAGIEHGIYVGRIWYTYPINGLGPGDFTCTVVGDSFIIENGRLAAPLKPNTIRINDNIHRILNSITGISNRRQGTLVWAADEVVYAPEIVVTGVQVNEIGGEDFVPASD